MTAKAILYEHQIDAILTLLKWGTDWTTDHDGAMDAYELGCRETCGHVLACWLCCVGGDDDGVETAAGRDMLFTDNGKARSRAAVRKKIVDHLTAAGTEIRHG